MKTDTIVDLPGGSTLPRNSASISLTNPTLMYSGHEKCLEFHATTNDSLEPVTTVNASGGRSAQILSTGLAAFSTNKPTSINTINLPLEATVKTNLEAINQPISSQQLVSIKLPDPVSSLVTCAAPTSPLPSSFYNDASLEYALSSSCTPLLLSLDTGAQLQFAPPNPILMAADPNHGSGAAYSTGYYDFDGAIAAAPILVQAPNPLTYAHLSTLEKVEDKTLSTS